VSNLDGADAGQRASILAAAETLFYDGWRDGPANGSSSSGDRSMTTTGERLGAYPDIATALASIGRDLEKGDLVFSPASDTSIFDLGGGPVERRDSKPLRSAVKCPDPMMAGSAEDECLPARLTAAFVDAGLRLTLTNEGAQPFSVNAIALRYPTADRTRNDFTGPGGAKGSYTELRVTLGFIYWSPATPADRLVVLAPKMEHTWVLPLRAEDREVDHVRVSFLGDFAIRGRPAAPLVAGFQDTWVK
jgi:hypothetical protein